MQRPRWVFVKGGASSSSLGVAQLSRTHRQGPNYAVFNMGGPSKRRCLLFVKGAGLEWGLQLAWDSAGPGA